MSATKSGVTADPSRIAVAKKVSEFAGFLLSDKGAFSAETLEAFDKAIQAVYDGFAFKTEVLKPTTFSAFLGLESRTQGMFNQLASEISWWTFLDQIEESCFFQPDKLAIARQFLVHMFSKEIAAKPYQPPKDWRYLPIQEAVERFRLIFGSSLNGAASILKGGTLSNPDGEGWMTGIKLTTLAKLFGVKGNPLEATEEGQAAYERIVELFIPKVGEAYVKAHSNMLNFANWREGSLTASHIVLTPAGRATWQWLESQSSDDFVTASADTGRLHAGYSQRRARVAITASGNQMPQDCIMTGGTLAIQPDRLCKGDHLRMDNPGNAYSFGSCVYWYFDSVARQLGFAYGDAVPAAQVFGSAVVLRS